MISKEDYKIKISITRSISFLILLIKKGLKTWRNLLIIITILLHLTELLFFFGLQYLEVYAESFFKNFTEIKHFWK